MTDQRIGKKHFNLPSQQVDKGGRAFKAVTCHFGHVIINKVETSNWYPRLQGPDYSADARLADANHNI